MNILKTLEAFKGTFTNWVAKAYAALYKEEPKIEAVADTVLKYAIPALLILIGMEAGQPAATEVGVIANEAVKDLHAVSALIYDFGPNPTVAGMVAGIQNNLAGLLTAGHITNAGSVAGVNKVVNSLGALVAALPAVQLAASAAA